jgi:hypothetical protein
MWWVLYLLNQMQENSSVPRFELNDNVILLNYIAKVNIKSVQILQLHNIIF